MNIHQPYFVKSGLPLDKWDFYRKLKYGQGFSSFSLLKFFRPLNPCTCLSTSSYVASLSPFGIDRGFVRPFSTSVTKYLSDLQTILNYFGGIKWQVLIQDMTFVNHVDSPSDTNRAFVVLFFILVFVYFAELRLYRLVNITATLQLQWGSSDWILMALPTNSEKHFMQSVQDVRK